MDNLVSRLTSVGFVNRFLRPHQEEGLEWLCGCIRKQNGCILADEMGLGKTTQSVALVALHQDPVLPCLVICPLSVINNWCSEFRQFLPGLSVLKYHGDAAKRTGLRDLSFNVLITTYEMVLSDIDFLGKKKWNLLVVDEGHRLKNSESLTSQLLGELETQFRLILSGTPVQNDIYELYSLLSFIDSVSFPLADIKDFCRRYQDESYNNELHELLRPFLLRRTKNQVLTTLPPSQESIMYCNLTDLQKKVYKACLVKDRDVINFSVNKTSLNNAVMQVRKCSDHPYMFNGIEPEPFCLGEHLVHASGKLNVLDKILQYCKSNNHRVLIFSQFTLMLDILQDYAHYRKYSYERLDGSIRDEERQRSLKNFDYNDVFIFLLSTKAGGVGLNLTAADTVIFYDGDWNPQNDIQAAARAHRIGQTKPVKIIRLISKHTIDEIMLNRMEQKLKLTKRVIVEGGFSTHDIAQEDTKTLSDMLMFGLNSLFSDSQSDEAFDIESVLGKSSEDGHWIFNNENNKNDNGISSEIEDYFDFEGTNYRSIRVKPSDQEMFQSIFDEAISIGIENEQNAINSIDPDQRLRTKPTSEQYAAKLQQLQILSKEQAKAEELSRERKRIAKEQAKHKKWDETGYISTALPSQDVSTDSSISSTVDIDYIVGDATKPEGTGAKLVLHCTDSSGEWGSGGLFTALSRCSKIPGEAYELAKDMGNLRLGQCHVCDFSSNTQVALLVCIRRGSSIIKLDLKSLDEALRALAVYAESQDATVHMPRIGFSTNDWYGVERLLRKCLTSRNIPTSVYYFSRRAQSHALRLQDDQSDDEQPGPSTQNSSNHQKTHQHTPVQPSPKRRKTDSSSDSLPAYFTGMVFYLDPDIKKRECDVLKRYIFACNGDILPYLDQQVTYVISYNSSFQTSQYRAQILSPIQLCDFIS